MKVINTSDNLLTINLNTNPPVGLHLQPGEISRDIKKEEISRELQKLIDTKKLREATDADVKVASADTKPVSKKAAKAGSAETAKAPKPDASTSSSKSTNKKGG